MPCSVNDETLKSASANNQVFRLPDLTDEQKAYILSIVEWEKKSSANNNVIIYGAKKSI